MKIKAIYNATDVRRDVLIVGFINGKYDAPHAVAIMGDSLFSSHIAHFRITDVDYNPDDVK